MKLPESTLTDPFFFFEIVCNDNFIKKLEEDFFNPSSLELSYSWFEIDPKKKTIVCFDNQLNDYITLSLYEHIKHLFSRQTSISHKLFKGLILDKVAQEKPYFSYAQYHISKLKNIHRGFNVEYDKKVNSVIEKALSLLILKSTNILSNSRLLSLGKLPLSPDFNQTYLRPKNKFEKVYYSFLDKVFQEAQKNNVFVENDMEDTEKLFIDVFTVPNLDKKEHRLHFACTNTVARAFFEAIEPIFEKGFYKRIGNSNSFISKHNKPLDADGLYAAKTDATFISDITGKRQFKKEPAVIYQQISAITNSYISTVK